MTDNIESKQAISLKTCELLTIWSNPNESFYPKFRIFKASLLNKGIIFIIYSPHTENCFMKTIPSMKLIKVRLLNTPMVEWNDFKISWRRPIAILVNSSKNHHSNLVTLEIFKILSRKLLKNSI